MTGLVDRREGCGPMVFWWCALGVVLAVVYMVAYTLLRTSGDGRPWTTRLLHPRAGSTRRHRAGRPD